MEEGDGLVEGISCLDVGEDDGIGLAFQGRFDALDAQAFRRNAGLQVERTVDDAASKLAVLGHFLDLQITHSEWEVLLVHLLCAVVQSDTRLVNAHGVAEIADVTHLFDALFVCGIGDDSWVGEEQQLVVFGHFGSRDVCEHTSTGQDALLFVEHYVQQIIGIDESFHEYVDLAFVHHFHGTTCSGIGTLSILEEDVVAILHDVSILFNGLLASNEDGVDESSLKGMLNRYL